MVCMEVIESMKEKLADLYIFVMFEEILYIFRIPQKRTEQRINYLYTIGIFFKFVRPTLYIRARGRLFVYIM